METMGRWITNGTTAPFYTRKVFQLQNKTIKSAVAQVCGLGQFILSINGRKVGDHELDPGWTNYNKLIQYVTFDVKDYVQPGTNVIGAEVGNGWYIKTDVHYTFTFPGPMPPNPNPYVPFGESLVFAGTLQVVYEDGTIDTVTTDDSWKTAEHPITMSNVYGSETYEAAKEQKGWNITDFDDSSWENASVVSREKEPEGKLEEQFQPPIKVIHTYEAKQVGTVSKKNVTRQIYDFGQNMSGMLELELRGRKGDVIKLFPAEKLDSTGDVDQVAKGWITVDSCITCIVGEDDVWETYRMKFAYFAGRFVAVEIEGSAEIRNLKADAISSAHKKDGSFTSSDERYNQIYDLVEKAVEANMVSVHTDCPTIERFAWQEPNHLMAPSIMYMKDGRKLWEKFLLDMRMQQHTAEDYFFDFAGNKIYPGDGLMPSQCPCYVPNVIPVPGMGSFYDIIPWGSTCILGTYWHYQFYGDPQVIADNYDAGMRYLKHLKTRVTEDGFINHGLGDWGNPKNDLARENIETAFLYADVTVLAQFANILGKQQDEAELLAYAAEIQRNYNEKLMVCNEAEGFWCYKAWDHPDEIYLTQACQALPLYWGLVTEERKADVAKALAYTLNRDGAFICGEVGLPYVIQCAREYGMNDLIAQFITKPEHPSYYAFVLDGLTTLGEYWENNPRSHCHDMMGHIIEWYYNGIAGIIPEAPGFKQVLIRPYLPKGMKQFTCSYHSVSGEIRVTVEETEKAITLKADAAGDVSLRVDTCNLEVMGKNVIVL